MNRAQQLKQKLEAKGSVEDAIRDIAQSTDQNDHWGSVEQLASFNGNKKMVKVIQQMSSIQDNAFGHSPPGFIEFRSFLTKELLKDFNKKHKDKIIQDQMRGAF